MGRLGIALSGGRDSLALLVLANAALPGKIGAATVDHQLRKGSRAEAVLAAEFCAELGVAHTIIQVDVRAGNLQGEARIARYQALSGWLEREGLDGLATGHHADDQAETLVMRLNRASGVAGLAGVRASRNLAGADLPLLRPLLGWRRKELRNIVETAGWVAADDPSNSNPDFDRVRIRGELADADWLDIPALAQSATHLADADRALIWASEREWREQVVEEPTSGSVGYRYKPAGPRAIRLRVLAKAINLLGGNPRGGVLARMDDALMLGRKANCAGVLGSADTRGWLLEAEPQRRSR